MANASARAQTSGMPPIVRTPLTRSANRPPRRTLQRGMAIVEFLLVALPLFLLGVGVIETTRWAVARQAISYALFEAVRTGAITNADPRAIRVAFERALIPLLGKGETDLADGHAAVQSRLAAFQTRWGIDGYRLMRVLPDQRAGSPLGSRPGSHYKDDSILVLDVTFLHAPLFPGVRQVLRRVALPSGNDRYADAARHAGLVVIRRDVAMPMQK